MNLFLVLKLVCKFFRSK